jgi:hypothetical protein
MGKKHEQVEEDGWAASKVGRKKKKEKAGRWREEEIRVLRREEDRRRETLSTNSTNAIIPNLNQSLKG